ncbi:MAG: hypothetical protein ACRDUX_04460 [Mycobacterium sp.]
MDTLLRQHDCLLLDLDGTLYCGRAPAEGSVDALLDAPVRALYVTNNASCSATQVAKHLCALGFAASSGDVVTSAQSAARLSAERLTTRPPP